MNRRSFLATVGVGLAAGVAGCSGGDDTATDQTGNDASTSGDGSAPFAHPGTLSTTFVTSGEFPADADPADGKPPEFGQRPSSPDADPSTFETLSVNGETVPLAPIDIVQRWYRRGEARFVDARGLDQYERAHIYGAVSSPAQRRSVGGGIAEWPLGDRIVTYCGCPHHLSSIRAAGLGKAGFENVYALDEGFIGQQNSWYDRAYPMAGTAFGAGNQASIQQWTISGSVDSRYAGEYVWATAGRQYEAAPVRGDGSYDLHLKFADVSPDTLVRVRTPTDAVEKPLGTLGSRA